MNGAQCTTATVLGCLLLVFGAAGLFFPNSFLPGLVADTKNPPLDLIEISDDELRNAYGLLSVNPHGDEKDFIFLQDIILQLAKENLGGYEQRDDREKLLNWDMHITGATYNPDIKPMNLRIVDENADLDVSMTLPNYIRIIRGNLYVAGDNSKPLGQLIMSDIKRSGEIVIRVHLDKSDGNRIP